MQVLIVRHGEAVPIGRAPTENERWLTDQGRVDVTRVGQAIAGLGLQYTCIYASPLVRAVQTAEILATAQPKFDGPVEVHPALGLDYGTIAQALEPLDHADDDAVIVLVSHMPKVRMLASHLSGIAQFPGFDAGAACLVQVEDGTGTFQWMMDPSNCEPQRP